jgi:hypothetical protein
LYNQGNQQQLQRLFEAALRPYLADVARISKKKKGSLVAAASARTAAAAALYIQNGLDL